jgi:hypothetical protein
LSLTLRDEHGLRVFENRVLRRIFGPKRDEASLNDPHINEPYFLISGEILLDL